MSYAAPYASCPEDDDTRVDDLLRAHLTEYPDQTARYVDPEGYELLVVDIVRARGAWALTTQDDVGLAETYPTYRAAMDALEARIAEHVARSGRSGREAAE